MDRGSLAEILSPAYPFPEMHIAYVCRCLLSALDALHSQNRIHRGNHFYHYHYHHYHILINQSIN